MSADRKALEDLAVRVAAVANAAGRRARLAALGPFAPRAGETPLSHAARIFNVGPWVTRGELATAAKALESAYRHGSADVRETLRVAYDKRVREVAHREERARGKRSPSP